VSIERKVGAELLKKVIRRHGMALALFLALAASAEGAGTAAKSKLQRSNEPIQVKSNELLTDKKTNTATFIGKVVAHQGDVTIYSDKMIVYNDEKSDELEKVEVFGNVRIVQENRIGTGGHGVYLSKTGKITLDTNPKVYQGDDVVTGKVITYNLDDETSVVTGGPDQRVEMILHPKEKKNAAKP
jgi:lipopolysaccharide export system protein LptA